MENHDPDHGVHIDKKVKWFSLVANEETTKINCAPDDIFDEKQYIVEPKPTFCRPINRNPDLWLQLERLRLKLTEIRCRETQKTRLFKLPIYSREDQTENLLFLLNRLSRKIEENFEILRRKSLEEVRTMTPLDLSYIEQQEDSNDDNEIDVVGISDSELPEFPSDENRPLNQLNDTTLSGNNTPIAPISEPIRKSSYSLKVFNRRTWKNVELDENSILQVVPKNQAIYSDVGIKRQKFMKEIIDKAISLLKTNSYATKRDLFYLYQSWCKCSNRKMASNDNQPTTQTQDVNPNLEDASNLLETPPQTASQRVGTQQAESQITGTQGQSTNNERYNSGILDEVLDDLCCLLGCSKIHLNILAQSKCIVYGNLNFELATGETFDCLQKSEGCYIPNPRDSITKIESTARFILVVEKDAILQRLINNKFADEYNAILFTAKGYPDWNSRAFLRYIWLKLQLPTFILTDCDPHGIEIACIYRFGSLNHAFENPQLALPHIKWLGLLPSDTTSNSDITSKEKLPLTTCDRSKLGHLFQRPYILRNRQWADQIRTIRELDYKVEIEGLDDKNNDNKLVKYLLNKIRFGSWL